MTFVEAITRFPEDLVGLLKSTPQPKEHHPEGSVYEHTRQVFELADSLELQIAALFHDLGKIDKTFFREDTGKIVAYGHELVAKQYIDEYKHLFPEITCWSRIKFICRHHMLIHKIAEMRPFKAAELRASPYFEDLLKFGVMDCEGRKPR